MGIIQKYNPLSGKFDLIHSEDSFDDITLVANYSALPAVATVTGKFYWASASQGTSWLPGNLGGTYYPKGMYYSNGVTWEFLDVPYQATQAEVNTGTNTDKFVTPATLRGNFGTTAGTVAAGDSLSLFMAIPKVCITAVFNIYNTYASGTRWMMQSATSSAFNSTSNNAIAQTPTTYSIISTDYPTINGVTPKFRLRATIGVNNTAPAANISFGLFPLTTPASSGGATVKSWTIGSEVAGSTITQNTPTANTQYQLVSATFDLPSDGLYAICITNSAQTAANSYMTNSATLEVFY